MGRTWDRLLYLVALAMPLGTGAAAIAALVHVPGPDVAGPVDWTAFASSAAASAQYAAFEAFLRDQRVDGIVPAWTLWRQGTDWRALGQPPFAIPPPEDWPGIVPTLALVRDEVVPSFGPVDVVSGFRTERYNQLAGGAAGSRHKWFEAVDVIPRRPWPRWILVSRLDSWWRRVGADRSVGLGIYEHTRFHVDTWKARRW